MITSLDPQDQQSFREQIEEDSGGGEPPDERVSDEIDLSMILSPKVHPTLQDRPRARPRAVRVVLDQGFIGLPHDRLEFPELSPEAWPMVINLDRVFILIQ